MNRAGIHIPGMQEVGACSGETQLMHDPVVHTRA